MKKLLLIGLLLAACSAAPKKPEPKPEYLMKTTLVPGKFVPIPTVDGIRAVCDISSSTVPYDTYFISYFYTLITAGERGLNLAVWHAPCTKNCFNKKGTEQLFGGPTLDPMQMATLMTAWCGGEIQKLEVPKAKKK